MAEIVIDYNKLQESASLIENEINNLKSYFDNENSYFELLSDNKKWYGISNEKCLSKYDELKVKYEEIINNLNAYKQYLLNMVEQYKSFNDIANKKVDNQ